jgi:hypothetical protein
MRSDSARALTAADRELLAAIEAALWSERHAQRVAAVDDAGAALRRLHLDWHTLLAAAKPTAPTEVWDLWVEVTCGGRVRTIRQHRLLRHVIGNLAAKPAGSLRAEPVRACAP